MSNTNLTNITVENYSDKSFVVRGEGTRGFKDTLKVIGGKWNRSLTDSKTRELFSAWIFSNNMRPAVLKAIADWNENPVQPEYNSNIASNRSTDHQSILSELTKLNGKIDRIERLLIGMGQVKIEGIYPDYNMDEDEAPQKRLLGRKK